MPVAAHRPGQPIMRKGQRHHIAQDSSATGIDMDIKLSLAGRTCCLEAIMIDSQMMCASQLPLTPQYKWPTEIRPKEKPKQFLLNMPVLLASWILTVPNSQRLVSQLVLTFTILDSERKLDCRSRSLQPSWKRVLPRQSILAHGYRIRG